MGAESRAGAMRKFLETFSRLPLFKAGEVVSMSSLTTKTRNPAQGVRSPGLRSTCPAWGASSLATGRTGGDLPRGPLANPAAVNSSTMKGPRGLAGESRGRRCRTANGVGRWVRGCFHVRSPEMVTQPSGWSDRNYAGSGELDIRPPPLPVTRDSDVSCEVKRVANAGSSAAAGLVPGAWRGQPGESSGTLATGKRDSEANSSQPSGVFPLPAVVPPKAVEWECGLSRSRLAARREPGLVGRAMFPARQWGLVGVVRVVPATNATTKGLTGNMYLSMDRAGDFISEVVGPWKGASGHTRPVREHGPSVAANRQRYPGVRTHSAGTAGRFCG